MGSAVCIMTAYADETRALLHALGQDRHEPIDWNRRLRFEGVNNGTKWAVFQSGMGKVRAASMCQKIVDTYQADTIFEFGFAGGLVDTVSIGDIVVITGVSEHDVPNRPEILREQEMWRTRLFQTSAATIERFTATLAANPDVGFRKASVVCGDMDIYDRDVRDRIAETSGGVAVTWESAAIVEVCALNNVRYLGVRVISDLCVEAHKGPIPKERMERIRASTAAYVKALLHFDTLTL